MYQVVDHLPPRKKKYSSVRSQIFLFYLIPTFDFLFIKCNALFWCLHFNPIWADSLGRMGAGGAQFPPRPHSSFSKV